MANKNPNMSGLKPFKKKEQCDSSEIERQLEANRKGAMISNERQKEQSRMQKITNMILQLKCNQKEEEIIKKLFPDFNEEITKEVLLITAQYKKALSGDNKSFEIIRDTAGQKPLGENQIIINNNQETKLDPDRIKKIIKDLEGDNE